MFRNTMARLHSYEWYDTNSIFYVIPIQYLAYRQSGQSSDDTLVHNCSYNEPPPKGKVCEVDIRQFGPCTLENHYSYHKNAPCIFLKLNKIYGWEPVFYDDPSSLPSDMPTDLKEYIKDKGVKQQHTVRYGG